MEKLFIQTKRLIIRPLEKKDFNTWKNAYLNYPKKRNPWDIDIKNEAELSKDRFNQVLLSQRSNRDQDKFYGFAVFSKMNGELIGFVSLMDLARSVFQNAYLGYRVFSQFWNQGFGKEMSKATLILAFRDLKLHRVEAGINPGNRRSIMLARSLGMRKEGLKKRALFIENRWQDVLIYSLTCEDLKLKFKGNTKKLISRPR